MNKKDEKKESKKKIKISKKKKITIIAVSAVVASIVGFKMGAKFVNENKQDTSDTEEVTEVKEEKENTNDMDNDEKDENYEDDRPELSEMTLEDVKEQTYQLASKGKWSELIVLLEKYDLEYNLETTEEGKYLKDMFWDANVISRLAQMGDDENAIIAGVEKLPYLKTPEMFVWGLYFLPRNNIVDLSVDTLALAPSSRGDVILEEKEVIPVSDENGARNSELDKHDAIISHMNNQKEGIFDNEYVRFDISNNGVKEHVYIGFAGDDKLRLVGFYSDDKYYSNKVETVRHFKDLSRDISAGVDELLKQAEEDREENRKNLEK